MALHQNFLRWQDLATATQRVLGRNTSGTGPIEAVSASQILDWISSTQGALPYRDSSAWAGLTSTNANYLLKNGGASANPSWVPAPYSIDYFAQVSAATTLTTNAISMDANRAFLVAIHLKNNTASNANISIYYNADTTAGNYETQRQLWQNATPTSGRANDAIVTSLPASDYCSIFGIIFNGADGKKVSIWWCIDGSTTAIDARFSTNKWATASTNITSITLSSSVATSIAANSNIQVWTLGNWVT